MSGHQWTPPCHLESDEYGYYKLEYSSLQRGYVKRYVDKDDYQPSIYHSSDNDSTSYTRTPPSTTPNTSQHQYSGSSSSASYPYTKESVDDRTSHHSMSTLSGSTMQYSRDLGESSASGYGGGFGESSTSYTAGSHGIPSESFYSQQGHPPGYMPPPSYPKPQEHQRVCTYTLPITDPRTGFATKDVIEKKVMKHCTNSAIPHSFPDRCIAHVGKAELFYECQAKVYKLDKHGNILADSKGQPIVEQEEIGYRRTRDKICGALIVSEKFFCEQCRPKFLRCSFDVAYPGSCDKKAQPDEPWELWANCWAHHGNPNKQHITPASEGNAGWPEAHVMSETNPAPAGPSRRDFQSGHKRGKYEGGSYEKHTRPVNDQGFITEHPRQDAQRTHAQETERERQWALQRDSDTEEAQKHLRKASNAWEQLDRQVKRKYE